MGRVQDEMIMPQTLLLDPNTGGPRLTRMGEDVTIGPADLSDEAVGRLIDPAALPALRAGLASISVVRAKGVPVAVAAAVVHSGRLEIMSLACLSGARETPALGWAVQRLRGSGPVVFDPTAPLADHVRRALITGGMAPNGPRWTWYRLVPEALATARPSVRITTQRTTLRAAHPEGYRQHPDDLLDVSPVLIVGGRPVAYAVIRGSGLLHWLWVDPRHRRQGLIMQLCAALYDDGLRTLRFRVDAANEPMTHVLQGAPPGTVATEFTEPGWVG